MKIVYDASSFPAVVTNHVFQLQIGHGEFSEMVEVELEERKVSGRKPSFALADNGVVDDELLEAIQMSGDELTKKLIEELKKQ